MAALPDVVKRLTDDIQWTTDLGNAFLAQQADVMNAVQRMRQKAEAQGHSEIDANSRSCRQGGRQQAGDRDRAGESAGRLRAVVQPGRCLRRAGLSVSADLLPVCRVLRGRRGDLVRRRRRDGRGLGRRRLGLERRLGRRRRSTSTTTTTSTATRTSTAPGTSTAAAPGSTTPHIAAALRTAIARPRTASAERHAAIRWRTVKAAARQQINRQGGQLGTSGVNRGSLGDRGAGNLGDRGGAGNRGGLGDRGSSGIGRRRKPRH